MIRLLLILSVLALLLSACAPGEESAGSQATATAPARAPLPEPPPEPATAVRVRDGDTGKPVRRAKVVAEGRPVAARHGIAQVGLPRTRVLVRASAPGYSARRVHLDFRHRRTRTVQLWRTALQWPIYGLAAMAWLTVVQRILFVRRQLSELSESPPI